jgi:hypothetical protein
MSSIKRTAVRRIPSSPRSQRATVLVVTPTSSANFACERSSCFRRRRRSSGCTSSRSIYVTYIAVKPETTPRVRVRSSCVGQTLRDRDELVCCFANRAKAHLISWCTLSAQARGCERTSCSQIRTTVQPNLRNSLDTRVSRLRFRTNLARQKSELVRGLPTAHRGQECQKHPSTNTHTRARPKVRSGVPGNRRCSL